MKIHLKSQSFGLLALGFAMSVTLCGGMALAQSGPYHVETQWKIGGDTGWDYLAIDPISKLLYVTHGDHVVVDADVPARQMKFTVGGHMVDAPVTARR